MEAKEEDKSIAQVLSQSVNAAKLEQLYLDLNDSILHELDLDL